MVACALCGVAVADDATRFSLAGIMAGGAANATVVALLSVHVPCALLALGSPDRPRPVDLGILLRAIEKLPGVQNARPMLTVVP